MACTATPSTGLIRLPITVIPGDSNKKPRCGGNCAACPNADKCQGLRR